MFRCQKMLNLEAGGRLLGGWLARRSSDPGFSTHAIPAALEMQLSEEVEPWAALPAARLLQHPPWDPEEQRAPLTLFKFILRAGAFSFWLWCEAGAFPWLEVTRSFHPVVLAGKARGARSSGNLCPGARVGAVGRTWPSRRDTGGALPAARCLPGSASPRPAACPAPPALAPLLPR